MTVIELSLTAPPPTVVPGAYLHPGLSNRFGAPFARLSGCRCTKRRWMEKFGDWHHADVLDGWTSGATAQWDFAALAPGRYQVAAVYECWAAADYSEFELSVAGQRWTFPTIYTGGGQGQRLRLREVELGLVEVPAGAGQLVLRAVAPKGDPAPCIEHLILTPAD